MPKPRTPKVHTLASLTALCADEGDCLIWPGVGPQRKKVTRPTIHHAGVQPVEGQHASATDGSRLNPSVVIDNSSTVHSLREAVLGEWLALETQTDVQTLRLLDPARVGDESQALTFGALA